MKIILHFFPIQVIQVKNNNEIFSFKNIELELEFECDF